ncbi:MAG: tRNA pseudouridine(38-40) synthase TruA [Pseudomonadota bacterium]
MRFAAGIEYAGTAYAGWQRQNSAPSVQAEVERALGFVADHPVKVVCAGRTDTGVHALGQVIHFETDAVRPLRGWLFGANTNLPQDVALRWIVPVAEDFSARYWALARTYRYVILNAPTRAPLLSNRVCLWRSPLDAARMHAALQPLVGQHDYSAFRASECQSKSPVRRLERIGVQRHGDFLLLSVTANAFLHHMVRNIAGSALAVGEGARPVGWIAEVLAGRDRAVAGITAPAGGLYFAKVRYPEAAGIPAEAPAGLSAIIGASHSLEAPG